MEMTYNDLNITDDVSHHFKKDTLVITVLLTRSEKV